MYRNKEWLQTEFLAKNRSAVDIGEECGVSAVTVRLWARKFGFRRRRWGSKKLNDRFFDRIITERQAYWLGFIAADGMVQNKKGRRFLAIALSRKDETHLRLFRDHIDSEHNIYLYERDKEYKGYKFHVKTAQLNLASCRLVEGLIKHGVVPNKTRILKPPRLKSRLIRHWIRGYFDGDGSVSMNNGYRQGSFFGTKAVMEFIQSRCRFLRGPYQAKSGWVLGCSGKDKIKGLHDFLYNGSTVYLKRKKNIFERM